VGFGKVSKGSISFSCEYPLLSVSLHVVPLSCAFCCNYDFVMFFGFANFRPSDNYVTTLSTLDRVVVRTRVKLSSGLQLTFFLVASGLYLIKIFPAVRFTLRFLLAGVASRLQLSFLLLQADCNCLFFQLHVDCN
jgi:hypothetical protein